MAKRYPQKRVVIHIDKKESLNIILVSMDLDLDPNPEKVYKFIARKNIQSQVLLLDERNPNEWINTIAEEWSGALPATLVVNTQTGERKFIESELSEGELEKIVSELK